VIVELAVYTTLVTIYALSVLKLLMDPLTNLYYEQRTWFAVAALALIVGQGVALEEVTSFLMDRLRFARFD
jgi:hypothetical protein